LLALCLLVCSTGIATRAQDTGLPLSREERVKVFERVWQAVNENYYDKNFNGVNWRGLRTSFLPLAEQARDNAELYSVLRRLVGELRDAHTRVYAPEDGFDRYRPTGTTVGLTVRRIENKPVVVWVEPGSEAARQGITPGFAVTAVDGVPVEQALEHARDESGDSSSLTARDLQSFSRLFYGPRETMVAITFIDEEARERTIKLTRRFVELPRRVSSRRLPGDFGYLELTGFAPEIERDFDRAMQSLKDTRGLILDLRNNGGGFVRTVEQVASYFFTNETDLGTFVTRQGQVTRHQTQALRQVYRGPLIVLVSARSASGAEMLTAAFQEHHRALIIGVNPSTCGCLLGVSRTLRLPDGGKLNVSDTDYRTARGRRIEGHGLQPDEGVEMSIADLLAGRDRALELAAERLTKPLNAGR
jgi:carboxyl-terminal processing protease